MGLLSQILSFPVAVCLSCSSCMRVPTPSATTRATTYPTLPAKQFVKPLPVQHAINVSEITQVPTTVRSKLPHGGVIKFYGGEKIDRDGNSLLFNFYSLSSRTDICVLEVFILGRGKRNPRFVRSIKVHYTEFSKSPELRKFDHLLAQMMWLDPKSKKVPVLRLKCFVDGFYGPYGNNFLFVFKKGITKEVCVQQFSFGGDHNEGHTAYFNYLDNRGVMMPTIRNSSVTHHERMTYLRWDGQRFSQWMTFTNGM